MRSMAITVRRSLYSLLAGADDTVLPSFCLLSSFFSFAASCGFVSQKPFLHAEGKVENQGKTETAESQIEIIEKRF